MVIDFHSGPRASILTWLSGAPARGLHRCRPELDVRGESRSRELRPRHSVENQWDLLAALDIGPPDRISTPSMPLGNGRRASSRSLARAGVHGATPADRDARQRRDPFRRWPVGSFAAVAAGLAGRDPARRVVITSGPSDREAADRVIAEARTLLGHDRGRVLDCGEFSLPELRALVDRAAVYIGGDSGPMHVAATSHVPIVSLYGPTLPARSAPWRATLWPAESVEIADLACRPCDQRSCLPGDFRCLTWIQPQQVIEAAERALTG